MSVRCIQNSGEYRVSGAVDRVPSSERRDTVSSLRRITRIAPFSTLSKPVISIDIALHYGDAAYGNIGSGNRLDFTAVGRDINILSRLELLCKDVGRPLLMT